MTANYYVGQRVSFSNSSGTIRFIGPVEGLGEDNIRLGIEWDNPARGKHDGQYRGKRYFECLSGSSTGGSFMRFTAIPDPTQTFLEAVREKYAPPAPEVPTTEHVISGKVAEEIGFEKIRRQQAQLHRLTVVLVDGHRINAAESVDHVIRKTCPKIIELDLSRNLFGDFEVIVNICGELDSLTGLRISNNRFSSGWRQSDRVEFEGIRYLEMKEMFIPFSDMNSLARQFRSLKELDFSLNALNSIPGNLQVVGLKSLALEFNQFSNLMQLSRLAELGSLESLKLKGNRISQIREPLAQDVRQSSTLSTDVLIFGTQLRFVDLSYNQIGNWEFVNELDVTFPGLKALRLSQNPIHSRTAEHGLPHTPDDPSMITVARIKGLEVLDYREILPDYRANAEGFYLSLIGKEIASVGENDMSDVISKHKRYQELCEVHGPPTILRKSMNAINPKFLEARLINFEFYVPPRPFQEGEMGLKRATVWREIPKSFNVYRVKGIVGRLFNYPPLSLRLTWETGIWDPIASYEDQVSVDEEDKVETKATYAPSTTDLHDPNSKQGRWMKREVEIKDTTRAIGVCVDGDRATVRVELILQSYATKNIVK